MIKKILNMLMLHDYNDNCYNNLKKLSTTDFLTHYIVIIVTLSGVH